MPQNEHMELHRKRYGTRLDAAERARKKEARSVKKRSAYAQKALGIKGKLFAKRRHAEKATMKKTIAMHEEKDKKQKVSDGNEGAAVPAYLMERDQVDRAKVLSNTIKQKRKEKAGKWEVPLPKVRPIAEDEMFKVLRTGKRRQKAWKRMVTKVTFVEPGFTRKPPKYERFIRPTGMQIRGEWACRVGHLPCWLQVSGAHCNHLVLTAITLRFAYEKGTRDTPRVENHILLGHFGREEKSQRQRLHTTGCDYQGYCD